MIEDELREVWHELRRLRRDIENVLRWFGILAGAAAGLLILTASVLLVR